MHEEAESFCQQLARQYDRDRYLAALLAPAPIRRALVTLYALAAGLDMVARRVSDRTLGQIRLQWWEDSLAAIARAPLRERAGGGHPVLDALATPTGGRLVDAPGFASIIARILSAHRGYLALRFADSDQAEPVPAAHIGDVAKWLGRIDADMFRLAALVAMPDAHNARFPQSVYDSAGAAYGACRTLSLCAPNAARSLPEWAKPDAPAQAGLSIQAIENLRDFRKHFVPIAQLLPVFLALRTIPLRLAQSRRAGPGSAFGPWRRQWAIMTGYILKQV